MNSTATSPLLETTKAESRPESVALVAAVKAGVPTAESRFVKMLVALVCAKMFPSVFMTRMERKLL